MHKDRYIKQNLKTLIGWYVKLIWDKVINSNIIIRHSLYFQSNKNILKSLYNKSFHSYFVDLFSEYDRAL